MPLEPRRIDVADQIPHSLLLFQATHFCHILDGEAAREAAEAEAAKQREEEAEAAKQREEEAAAGKQKADEEAARQQAEREAENIAPAHLSFVATAASSIFRIQNFKQKTEKPRNLPLQLSNLE